MNNDNLYEINKSMSNNNNDIYQGHYKWDPGLKSYATFYQSAEFNTVSDVIKFFHEAWGHPSKQLICWIVKK